MTGLRPLRPWPLRVLLGRIAAEWESRHRIFDMPSGRYFHPEPVHDLATTVGGHPVATPLGPAAGPHTQLAQNFVLGWLAGARAFELKTVQILDELDIPRPCIDMEKEGYNVEWSQELSIDQSLEEYAKAWMLLEILSHWEPLRPHLHAPGPHIFDTSIGYDLAGIRHERMDAYIRGLLDASDVIDELRPQIPEPFAAFRDHPYPARLTNSVTLSTFHGCPPDEIEAIARHVMDTYGLSVVVKLNPTLLGYDEVGTIVRDELGYDVVLKREAFDADLQLGRALEMITSLQSHATERGLRFGVKLTNTLVVGNTRDRLPGEEMYLSGPPLHVIAVALLARLHEELPGLLALGRKPGPVAVSFSAGIDDGNVADAVGLGLAPVTVCSNLLKPGGYGHLSTMLKKLGRAMQDAACNTIPEWIRHRDEAAVGSGSPNAVAAYASSVRTPEGRGRYVPGAMKPLRRVDRRLELWDCVSCNLCVTVCPNDAMLHLATPEGIDGLTEKWQYFCLAELCNDCGNCTTFCPEDGDPFRVKPRLFLDRTYFDADDGPAVLVTGNGHLDYEVSLQLSAERDLLAAVLDASAGLPVRPSDLG